MKIETVVDAFKPPHIDEGKTYLNVKLKTTEDRARIIFLGDFHVGAPNDICDIEKIRGELKYIEKTKNTYAVLMGDLADCASKMRQSGPNVYQQTMPPQQQYESLLELLAPVAEKKKILCMLSGNHEDWIAQDTGIMIIRNLCRELKTQHIASGGNLNLSVEDGRGQKQTYLINLRHGKGNARGKVKMAALVRQTEGMFADIFACGHVHSLEAKKAQLIVNGVPHKCYYLLTGHFLIYAGSYAQNWGLSPEPTGCIKAHLFTQKKDVHVNL